VCERFGGYERSFGALETALDLVGDSSPLLAARLLGKEATLLELVGRYEEAFETCERGLARLDEAGEGPEQDAARATIELGAGSIHYRRTSNEEAIQWLEAAAEHAGRAGERGTLAHAYYLLDAAHTDLGRSDGLRYLELARPIYEELGDLRGLGVVLSNLGIHAYYEGRWDESIAFYRESREAKERSGDVIGAVIQVNNEAEILSDQGRLDEARRRLEEARRVWRAAGYRVGAALATSNLGRVAARARRFEEAHELLQAAADTFQEIGATAFVHENAARVAECLVLEGRYAEAREVVDATLDGAQDEPGATAALERLAGYAIVQARQPGDEARAHLERSLAVARALGADYEIALTLRALADTKLAGDVDAARRESEELLERLGVVSLTTPPLP
jgi:tetratricopeptide (TPR) repeat protein